jgi:ABC-2 type transport system permease protein
LIRLARSELLRIRSRRLVWILAILALVGILVGVGIGTAKSHKPTAVEVAHGDRVYAHDVRSCLNGRFIKEAQLPPGETLETWCADNVRRGQYVFSSGTVLQLSGLEDILKGTSFLLIVIGLVIGASSVGADWQSESMATLLTWEPRRIRVLLTRVLVVMVVVFALAVVLQALLSFAMTAGSALRGASTTPPGFLTDVVEVTLRVGAVAAAASVIAVAISTIGRSTAASLGVIFVYLALVESLLRGLVPKFAPWLLSVNLVAVVDGRAQDLGGDVVVSLARGITTVGAYAVVLLVLALVFFRSRDVT